MPLVVIGPKTTRGGDIVTLIELHEEKESGEVALYSRLAPLSWCTNLFS